VCQRRAEIQISRPDDAQGLLTQPIGQDAIALATRTRDESSGAVRLMTTSSESILRLQPMPKPGVGVR
jgi:hypothetical protein